MGRGRKMNRLAGVSHQPLWTVTPDWVNNGNVRRCVCVCVCVKTERRKKTDSCRVCASGQGLATPPLESHAENVRQCFHPSHLLIHWRKRKVKQDSPPRLSIHLLPFALFFGPYRTPVLRRRLFAACVKVPGEDACAHARARAQPCSRIAAPGWDERWRLSEFCFLLHRLAESRCRIRPDRWWTPSVWVVGGGGDGRGGQGGVRGELCRYGNAIFVQTAAIDGASIVGGNCSATVLEYFAKRDWLQLIVNLSMWFNSLHEMIFWSLWKFWINVLNCWHFTVFGFQQCKK